MAEILQFLFSFVLAYNLACVIMPGIVRNWMVVGTVKVTETGEVQRMENPDKTPFLGVYFALHLIQVVMLVLILSTFTVKGFILVAGILTLKIVLKKLIPIRAAIRLSSAVSALMMLVYYFA